MSFNQKFLKLIAVLLATTLVSCGIQVGDRRTKNRVLEIPSNNIDCIQHLGEKIQSYWDEKLSSAETDEFFTCVQSSLNFFLIYTEGDDRESYSTEEIYVFLVKYFFKDSRLTSNFAAEIMRLKAGVFGGSPTRISRAEFKSFIQMIGRVGRLAVQLRPHLRVFKAPAAGDIKPTYADFERAFELLATGVYDLGAVVKDNGQQYDLNRLGVLVEEVRKFLFYNENQVQSQYAQKTMDLAKTFSRVAVASGSTLVPAKTFGLFLEQATRMFRVYLGATYYLNIEEFFAGNQTDIFFDIIEQSLKIFDRVLENSTPSVIHFEDIDQAYDLLERFELLPMKIKSSSLKVATRNGINTLLRPISELYQPQKHAGIGPVHILRLRQEFELFKNQYLKLLDYRRADGSIDVVRLLRSVPKNADFGGPPGIAQRAFEFLVTTPPIFKMGEFQPRFDRPYNWSHLNHNFFDASLKAFVFIGVRLMGYAYPKDIARSLTLYGIDEHELTSFFDDFRLILQDIQVLHPEALGVGPRLFFEGNAFTFSADGYIPASLVSESQNPKRFMDLNEGLEFLTLLMSNFFVGRKIFDDLSEVCPKGGSDYFGLPRIQRACFIRRFKGLVLKRWEAAPMFLKYLQGVSDADWKKFLNLLLESVADWDDQTPAGPQFVQSTAVASMTMILHYIESLLVQFDVNQNQRIDTDEAKKAYVRFKYMLKDITIKMCKKVSDKDLEGVFLYILKKRKVPDDLAWVEIARGNLFGWGIDEDRLSLLETFTLIVRMGKEAGSTTCN